MKKMNVLLVALLVAVFAIFAMGSGESTPTNNDQGKESVENNQLGDYTLVIDGCRMAEDLEGDPVVIVKYIFTNVSDDDATSYSAAFDDEVYQNGIGLNESWFVDDSANYSADNKNKEIKKGATIEVEVAYELNDTTTDIEVEVSQLFSFDDTTITKTMALGESAAEGGNTSEETTAEQEPAATVATQPAESSDRLGNYSLIIDSCRMAKDYEGKPVVIVKYIFSNVSSDNAAAFSYTLTDAVYQNGVGLNEAWILADNANYSMDNQSKEIKKGATIEVEVAYELNDTTTDIEVEVSELFSLNKTTITKTFSIA